MEFSRTISLLTHVSRFVILAFTAAIVLPPALSAQTAKDLIGEACYNELRHRETKTLWSYTAERHADNHISLERVIESVDGPVRQLRHRETKTLWSYTAERHADNHISLERVIESVDGPVRHLLAVDGHPPTAAQIKEEDDRHQELLKSPAGRRALQKQRDDDDKTMEELLRIIPEAFVFEDQGKEGESERIAFHPNPGFKPKTYEQRIVHALDGMVFIDLHDKRIARLSGSLGSRVEFGYGLIGHVDQGGTTEFMRVRLSPQVWKTSAEKIDLDGRFVMLKTINKHQDESRTGFEPVAPDTTFAQALDEIGNK